MYGLSIGCIDAWITMEYNEYLAIPYFRTDFYLKYYIDAIPRKLRSNAMYA